MVSHLLSFLVVSAVAAVRCQSNRVIEFENLGDFLNEVDGVAFKLSVSFKLIVGLFDHAVGSADDGRHDDGFIRQDFLNFLLLVAVGPREIDALSWVPRAAFTETVRWQLDDVKHEIGAKALMIELDDVGEAAHFDNLHVVDEAVAVWPCVLVVAWQRVDVNLLAWVEVVQGFREQMNCVVHERRLRLYHRSIVGSDIDFLSYLYVRCRPILYRLLNEAIFGIDQPEGGDVCSTVPERLQVDGVEVERCD